MLLGSSCGCSRRSLLKGMGAAAIVGAAGVAGAEAATPSPRRIDVHHHCFPKQWFKEKQKAILASSDNAPQIMLEWTPQKAIEQLDQYGIATAILSVGNPGVWYGKAQESRHLSRSCNEYMAQMARDFPGRFGVFMALPMIDVEGSLKEIEYAYDVLKVDGVQMLTSYGDIWPGDPKFNPIYEELNRRKAVVFIHPVAPNCCGGSGRDLQPGIAASVSEYPFDEARAIQSILFNGVTARYPNVTFIFTHAGGPAPILAMRWEQQMRHPEIAKNLPGGVVAALRKMYFDVANSTVSPPAMDALLDLMPKSNIVFGSDYPYVRVEKTVTGLDKLKYTPEFTAAINRDNALKLFPRFA